MKRISFIFLILIFSLNASAVDLTNSFMNNLNSYFSDKFPTAEIGLSTGVTNEITASNLVVKPLSDQNDNENTVFS